MKVNFKNSFWHQFVEHFIVMCINQIFSKKSLETSSILILFKKKKYPKFRLQLCFVSVSWRMSNFKTLSFGVTGVL